MNGISDQIWLDEGSEGARKIGRFHCTSYGRSEAGWATTGWVTGGGVCWRLKGIVNGGFYTDSSQAGMPFSKNELMYLKLHIKIGMFR